MKLLYQNILGLFFLQVIHGSLIANFDENQIKGRIYFNNAGDGNTNISFAFDDTFANITSVRKIKIIKAQAKPYLWCKKNENRTIVTEIDFDISKKSHLLVNSSVNTKTSVLGHTVMMYGDGDEILACSTIVPMSASYYYASSIMGPKISGKIEFLQGHSGVTAIFGKVMMSDGISNMTYKLHWYISTRSTSDWMKCKQSALSNIFNDTEKDFSGCSQENMSDCRIGDLSGKHGNVTVGGMKDGDIFYIDTNLDMMKVKNLALVFKKGDKVVACGNIKKSGPWTYQSVFHEKMNSKISGRFLFTQDSPFHSTKVKINLKGLDDKVKSYHVHEYLIESKKSKCSPPSVGGHLNPYGEDPKKNPAVGRGTMDQYEIGDLSGKYGFMMGKMDYEIEVEDANLPLYTSNTILGRSIVIHADDNSRYTCSDISPVNATVINVMTNFTKANISGIEGYVYAKQWKSADGMLTPTVMIVKLRHKNNDQTSNHNWHVHTYKYNKNETGKCQSVGGHYNPSKVDVAKKSVYKRQCTGDTFYRCELGDTSGKCGTYDITGKKRFYVDDMTPLFGRYSVVGRSFTFHEENRAGARLTCADIIPMESDVVKKLKVNVTADFRSPSDARNEIISYLGIDESQHWTINSVEMERLEDNSCVSVSFYLLGESKATVDAHTEKWKKIMEYDEQQGTSFRRCSTVADSANSLAVSSILILFIAIVHQIFTS